MNTIHIYTNGRFEEKQTPIVREFPLVLHVNGREIATLITSPHDLRFLVAGFLRLQGFVESLADFHMFAVCDDFGIANVRIKNELPERLKPVLTSGCGTGITFTLEDGSEGGAVAAAPPVAPDAVFRLMEELAHRADSYRSHGGIHSAAVGDGEGNLILFAEDIGRHNTLDRIAGEALFKGIDLAGKILVTSGRVSTEMAAKCARLGIALVASRTSATDMAVTVCEKAGICLVGYVRGGKFTVYAHRERMTVATHGRAIHELPLRQAKGRIPGVTGVILAGGQSSRMGSNKALLPYKGGRFIEAIHRQFSELFDEVILVTNNPEQYDFLPCRKVGDVYPGMGALAGIHAGLHHAANQAVFVAACDMPYLNSDLVRHLATRADPGGVLIPESPQGLEPLHAVYGKGCLAAIEATLLSGQRRIVSFFARTNVNRVNAEEVALFDPGFDTFSNINTPADYYRLRDGERGDDHHPAAELAGAAG
ncbi:formate dehydrogenase accessory sulfurtransferase FdhD [Geobacter pickeringii]|uniref:Multifunctional fusion protein n=1 Tax=Geobacter pickeringii TaxID=345632 RepID=A0A0B5BCF7_9BACT|nr:formate dehydrogenase accessory sulfurtransferase FdhD [Geobacter pickeringii]AJE02759.1 formate dehydrogenase [Geobacter pickeringii]